MLEFYIKLKLLLYLIRHTFENLIIYMAYFQQFGGARNFLLDF